MRPGGTEPESSRVLVGFVTAEPQRELSVAAFYFFLLYFILFFAFSRAAPAAHGGSQAWGPIGTAAAGLHHSHSNAGFELWLRPTLQLTAMVAPSPTEQGQGPNPQTHGS